MSKIIRVAIGIEASIRQELERLLENSPLELTPILSATAKFHSEVELLLDKSHPINSGLETLPAVDFESLIGKDAYWQDTFKKFAAIDGKSAADLVILWSVYSMVENSAQYYQQAALNAAHPGARLFFSSLKEAKNALRRRIQGILRIMYNEIWEEVGFAPFTLGKE